MSPGEADDLKFAVLYPQLGQVGGVGQRLRECFDDDDVGWGRMFLFVQCGESLLRLGAATADQRRSSHRDILPKRLFLGFERAADKDRSGRGACACDASQSEPANQYAAPSPQSKLHSAALRENVDASAGAAG